MQKESTYEVVVDLETLSLADNCVIASIGAVKIDTATLKPVSTFYRRVRLTGQDKSHIDPGTVSWWNEQDAVPRREAFINEPRSLIATALYDFGVWLSNARAVWGNGTRQDIVWLESAYRNYAAVPVPWAYDQARCFRTMSAEFPEVQWHLFEGIAHHALDDAISEVIHLANIWAFKRGQPLPGLRYEDFVRVPMNTHLTAPWQPLSSAGTTAPSSVAGKTFEGITLHEEAVAKLLADRGVKAWELLRAAPRPRLPHCPGCGEFLEGDGYRVAIHCPEVDVDEATPDSGPHFCSGRDEVEALPEPNAAPPIGDELALVRALGGGRVVVLDLDVYKGATVEAVAKLLADRGVKAREAASEEPAWDRREVMAEECGPHFCSGRDGVEVWRGVDWAAPPPPGPNAALSIATTAAERALELFRVMAYLSEGLKEHGVRIYQAGPYKFNVHCEGGPDAAKVKGELAKVLAAWDPTHGVSLVTLNAVVDFMNTKLDEGRLNE